MKLACERDLEGFEVITLVRTWRMRNADNMDSKDRIHEVSGRDKDSTGNWSTEPLVSDKESVCILPMS